MRVIKAFLFTILYIFSAFVVAAIISVITMRSYQYYQENFTLQPTTQQLQLSEVVLAVEEIVISYWNKNEQCPSPSDLSAIKQLAMFEAISVKSVTEKYQCIVTIDLTKQYFAGKQLKQIISFKKVAQPSIDFQCYHNMPEKSAPYTCKSLRDIDSFNKAK